MCCGFDAGLVLDRNNAPYIIYVVHQYIIRYKNKDVLDALTSLCRRCSSVYKGENCYLLNEVVVSVVIRSRHDYLIEKCLANN